MGREVEKGKVRWEGSGRQSVHTKRGEINVSSRFVLSFFSGCGYRLETECFALGGFVLSHLITVTDGWGINEKKSLFL